MPVPVGLNVWSRLVAATFPYFDRVVAPFDSAPRPDGTLLFAETVLPNLE
jgi:hypothetical protein